MENQEQKDQQEAHSAANRARHTSQCSICLHPNRELIEDEWVHWGNTTSISERFGVSRDSLYRHARIFGLYGQRQKNLKAVYEKIIERLDFAPVTGSVVLSALRDYAKLVAAEQGLQQMPAAEPVTSETGVQEEGETEARLSGDAATPLERPEVEKPAEIPENTTVQ